MWFLFLTPILISIFYLLYINLSFDALVLFLPQKIFLGKWLVKGVLPLFNPHIFAGIPFAFDLGSGNFHPFNLFFLLPYPFSFSLWAGLVSFLFLIGFYLFFSQFTKTKKMSLLLTFILFFSGSGLFLRMNNPTIVSVIAYYGLFLHFLKNLKQKKITQFILPLLMGAMMTLAGHIQFVIYGYFLGGAISLFFYKIPFKKLFLFFLLLFIVTSWYYIFSLPLVIESTRVTGNLQNFSGERIEPFQYLQLILPFIFGEVYSGARWNVGYSLNILTSLIFFPLLFHVFLRGKYSKWLILMFLGIIIFASGFIPVPFFRVSSQIFILLHILGLTLIAANESIVFQILNKLKTHRPFLLALIIITLISAIFLRSPVFSQLIKPPNLFFDKPTIAAIGNLLARSLFLLSIFILSLLAASIWRKKAIEIFIIYVIAEGVTINFFFNYFIETKYLPNKFSIPKNIDMANFRIQTAADVVPYFGLSNYIDNIFFRPPFSKEKTLFDENERKNFSYFKNIMTYIPSNWSMVAGIKAVQGYNTFVPKEIAEYFSTPSADFREQYAQILDRNPEFGKNLDVSNINAINTSFITMTDKRWQDLGVGYFIGAKDKRYFSENKQTLPLYVKQPFSENPNEMIFKIDSSDVGKTLVVNINPAGFTGESNGKRIILKKEKFRLMTDLKNEGILKIYYSPITHLREIFIQQSNLGKKKPKG